MKIYKKTWPKWFNKILRGEKNVEFRLADFKVKKGDILILEEYNPKTKKYTGRTIEKRIVGVHKINPFEFYSIKDLKKYGVYLIEMQ
jgi:ASC-1-like (ASCH) protein